MNIHSDLLLRNRPLSFRLVDDLVQTGSAHNNRFQPFFFPSAGRKSKKGKKFLLPLLLLLKLKAAALLPLAIGALALISFKALIIGKLALILSGIIALKKLLEHKHSSSYEVVAHPSHHSYAYDEAHGAFRRSIDAQKLAYAAQKN